MSRMKTLNSLYLKDKFAVNHKIGFVIADQNTFVIHGQLFEPFKGNAALCQFMRQRRLINGLQKAQP